MFTCASHYFRQVVFLLITCWTFGCHFVLGILLSRGRSSTVFFFFNLRQILWIWIVLRHKIIIQSKIANSTVYSSLLSSFFTVAYFSSKFLATSFSYSIFSLFMRSNSSCPIKSTMSNFKRSWNSFSGS